MQPETEWKARAERAELALRSANAVIEAEANTLTAVTERATQVEHEIAESRAELARVETERVEANVARDFAELAANKAQAELSRLQAAQGHMDYCRAILNVPSVEVLAGAIERLQAREAALRRALKKHHDHASEGCNVFFEQDGKPIEIATDLGEAYQDSELCEQTCAALAPAHELGLEDKA